jgi:hypothetical protein
MNQEVARTLQTFFTKVKRQLSGAGQPIPLTMSAAQTVEWTMAVTHTACFFLPSQTLNSARLNELL